MTTPMGTLPNIHADQFDQPTLAKLAAQAEFDHPPRILMLYGSLRERSFSRFLVQEGARLLEQYGAEVRIPLLNRR